jgi:hypothetical protein
MVYHPRIKSLTNRLTEIHQSFGRRFLDKLLYQHDVAPDDRIWDMVGHLQHAELQNCQRTNKEKRTSESLSVFFVNAVCIEIFS